jgi:hypothetical protein
MAPVHFDFERDDSLPLRDILCRSAAWHGISHGAEIWSARVLSSVFLSVSPHSKTGMMMSLTCSENHLRPFRECGATV